VLSWAALDCIEHLLHDAECRLGGYDFAELVVHDAAQAAQLKTEVRWLVTQAHALDPLHAAPWWKDVDSRIADINVWMA
jgi:hypothetical protein